MCVIPFNLAKSAPEIIAKNCKKNGSRLIHISTDSVFDGNKGMYTEEDLPNPDMGSITKLSKPQKRHKKVK